MARKTPYREALDVLDDLPSTIRVAQKMFGLSQRGFARRAGVSPATMSRMMAGQGGISLENVRRLLETLDTLARDRQK